MWSGALFHHTVSGALLAAPANAISSCVTLSQQGRPFLFPSRHSSPAEPEAELPSGRLSSASVLCLLQKPTAGCSGSLCLSDHPNRQPLVPLHPTFTQAWMQPPLLHSPKHPKYKAFGHNRAIFLQRKKLSIKLGRENCLSLECVGPLSQQRESLVFFLGDSALPLFSPKKPFPPTLGQSPLEGTSVVQAL